MPKRRGGCGRFLGSLILAIVVAGGITWFQLRPTPVGQNQFIRFDVSTKLDKALDVLQSKGIIRSARFSGYYAAVVRKGGAVARGTYQLAPGVSTGELLDKLQKPVRRMVRIPEGWWIARVAKRLEEEGVCPASEYVEWAGKPAAFKDDVAFPLPSSGSLEGYLYPDTYDLPPLITAKEVVRLQLKTFERKVPKEIQTQNLRRTLTVASLVQAETARDSERPQVAGVIENRLKKGMKLEIDATVLYGTQNWRVLKPGEVRNLPSDSNTYLHKGLPPGPICSPEIKSILAAAAPAHHSYLFYVALPDKSQLFASTYEQHLANIKKRIAAIQAAEKSR